MSIFSTLPNLKTRNPNLPIPRASDFGIKNAVFLYDMLTYSSSTVLTDLSGNGYDATFNAAPTTTSEGTSFTGTHYADCAAGTADFYDNITGFCALKLTSAASSKYALGNGNDDTALGIGLITRAGWTPRLRVGISANDSTGFGTGTAQTTIANNAYVPLIFKVERAVGRIENMNSGVVTMSRNIGAVQQKAWRIGGYRTTADALYLPLDNGVIGVCGLIDGVTTRAQDVAILAYMKELMAARGVTL